MPSQTNSKQTSGIGRFLAHYRPNPGVPDELVDGDGNIRPIWQNLIEAVSSMKPAERAMRFARGDQYLRDGGVFYRQYGPRETVEREWPISHMPVLLNEAEWAEICAGLTQRADLLERIAADLYGENTLVRDGRLPAQLVAGNPEWLRPMVGQKPRSGNFLDFVAFDIGRGPSGKWWVLADRTQAPSGSGFALENRIATSRVFAEHYARANVHRLAGFFREFRGTLLDMRDNENGRVGILTPGPMTDTYFEHAYIARYLGFMQLEGEDLTVRDGRVMIRTVSGLKPISVLWRRLDARWADPLELDESSQIGAAGLVSAVRAGNISLVNALGSGVLETRALMAFLPRLCSWLTGGELLMPNVATWWCGHASERDFVAVNFDQMTIGNAFSTQPGFEDESLLKSGTNAHADIRKLLTMDGERLVAQEKVTLSTAPAFEGDAMVARPMTLRVFMVRTKDGWTVMPGGFARIGMDIASSHVAMQQGGRAADVWIIGKKPVERETMLPVANETFVRQPPGLLPSRAADNLFWLGRYVERAEDMIRIVRAYHVRLAENFGHDNKLLELAAEFAASFGAELADGFPASIGQTISYASRAAGRVRDRLSNDGWNALQDLAKTIAAMEETAQPGSDTARAMGVLLRKISGFSGLVHDNMYRFTGWRFLAIGRSLERAISLTSLLGDFADAHAPDGSLDFAIEVADSTMSHRRRYTVATNRSTVVDLIGLDPLNPRSITYQIEALEAHFGFLPHDDASGQMSPLQKTVLKVRTALALHTPETLDTKALVALGGGIAALTDDLYQAYLR